MREGHKSAIVRGDRPKKMVNLGMGVSEKEQKKMEEGQSGDL